MPHPSIPDAPALDVPGAGLPRLEEVLLRKLFMPVVTAFLPLIGFNTRASAC